MNHHSKKLSDYEIRIYESVVERAKLVRVSIDRICKNSKVAPSTFSRWRNGHCSGLVRTLGRMDDLLTNLELVKLQNLEERAKRLRFSFNDICDEAGIYYLDVSKWKRKSLPVDYKKLEEISQIIINLENQSKEKAS